MTGLQFCEVPGCHRGNLAAAVEQTMCRHEHLLEIVMCAGCLDFALRCPPRRCGFCAVEGVTEEVLSTRFVPVPDQAAEDAQ